MAAFIARQENDLNTPTEIAAYVEWAVPSPQPFSDDKGRGQAPPPIFPFMWADVDENDPQNPVSRCHILDSVMLTVSFLDGKGAFPA